MLGDTVGTESPFYYGSYYGGIFAAPATFTEDGATIDPAGSMQVTIGNRYEGANVVEKDGYYYLFVSATNCCNGALTGYSVFVGRSEDPYGPFVDREGVSLLDSRVGGTPFLTMNGNRWVGTGHNSVFQDASGQWWTAYHAVDQEDPFFEGEPGFTKRPVLLDPVDWVDGWPTVRGGLWASDTRMPAPAAQEGERSRYRTRLASPQEPGRLLVEETFDSGLDGWTWVREPAAGTYSVADGELRWQVQDADLYVDNNTASVLTTEAPDGDYVVQAKVSVDVPEGCCFNYAQAGLVVYGDDDNFVKLDRGVHLGDPPDRVRQGGRTRSPRAGAATATPSSALPGSRGPTSASSSSSSAARSSARPAATPSGTPRTPARTARPGCAAGCGRTPSARTPGSGSSRWAATRRPGRLPRAVRRGARVLAAERPPRPLSEPARP